MWYFPLSCWTSFVPSTLDDEKQMQETLKAHTCSFFFCGFALKTHHSNAVDLLYSYALFIIYIVVYMIVYIKLYFIYIYTTWICVYIYVYIYICIYNITIYRYWKIGWASHLPAKSGDRFFCVFFRTPQEALDLVGSSALEYINQETSMVVLVCYGKP